MHLRCPSGDATVCKKNGLTRHGDQNHKYLICNRQFVLNPKNQPISEEKKNLVRKLLLERLSLRAICRVVEVSLSWLLNFIKDEYAKVSCHLSIQVSPDSLGLVFEPIQADEFWSYLGRKKHKVWIWIALDVVNKQVVAVHFGGCSEKDIMYFWQEIPKPYRSGCDVYQDLMKI